MLESLIIGLVFALIMFLVIAARSGKSVKNSTPSNNRIIYSNLDFDKVFKAILQFTVNYKLKIDYMSKEEGKVVLSDELSFSQSNCFYPISLKKEEGKIKITVGIKPKVGFGSYFIGSAAKLDSIENGIKSTLILLE
ncbi:MAG TPA: hypothetical protein VIK14_03950 [Ignavibacteria bacterium]